MAYGAKTRPKDGIHKAEPGDTVSSIAASYGITEWESRVWDASENAELKKSRENPNELVPGDAVFIPDLDKKQEGRPTDAWHDFHVVRNKRFLRLKLQDENGDPIKNEEYQIETDQTFRGTFVQQGQATDEEGKLEEEIPHTMTKATLVLPKKNLRTKLMIGYLQPLPMSDPVKPPSLGSLTGALSGALSGSGGGLLDAAKSAVGGGLGGLAGSATGVLSGGLSLGGGASGGGVGGASTASLSAGGGMGANLAGAAKGALGPLANAVSAASATAKAAVKAVAGALGDGVFPKDTDPNIYPAAQRLVSMGFDAGEPKNDVRTAQFSGALLEFQAWCKERGQMPAGAGGMLGDMTAPGGALAGGGPLGDIGTALAGPLLSAVGLTGQLDQPTIDALKKIHGC